ncbi:MAG: hypothetical protein GF309_02220 [Candidatus Lokiarchaeota archaeon]|nr:hypothetical protein [Candidatus Lokiarchaeota archaeon]
MTALVVYKDPLKAFCLEHRIFPGIHDVDIRLDEFNEFLEKQVEKNLDPLNQQQFDSLLYLCFKISH